MKTLFQKYIAQALAHKTLILKWIIAFISLIDLSFFIEIALPEYIDWDLDEDFIWRLLVMYVVIFLSLITKLKSSYLLDIGRANASRMLST